MLLERLILEKLIIIIILLKNNWICIIKRIFLLTFLFAISTPNYSSTLFPNKTPYLYLLTLSKFDYAFIFEMKLKKKLLKEINKIK